MATQPLALKSGFKIEGTLRKEYKMTSGKLVELRYFGQLDEAFAGAKNG